MKSHLFLLVFALIAAFGLPVCAQDATPTEELLKSGDRVSVNLWRKNDSGTTVGMTFGGVAIVDGKLRVPLLGDVQAAGLTADELKQVLEVRYAKQISGRYEVVVTVGAPPLEFKPLPPQKPQPKFIPLAPASLQSPKADQ
jgi:protein involved in polysaccharide export with SLBB domain